MRSDWKCLGRLLVRLGGVIAVVTGCATSFRHIPSIGLAEPEAFKVLKAEVSESDCWWSWIGAAASDHEARLKSVLGRIGSMDHEIAVLRDVELNEWWLPLGVLDYRCLSVRAIAGRTVPSVELPMNHGGGGHEHHHH